MMYPYRTFSDGTEITHSPIKEDGTVKVYIETPTDNGFNNLTCTLPKFKWENNGYDSKELEHWKEYVRNNAYNIWEIAKSVGFSDISSR